MIELDFAVFIPIAAIIASAWMVTSVLRYKRSKNEVGASGESDRQSRLLAGENERLCGQVSRLEERIAVLERIATDPADRTAREIESLR
jgi:hypothetical protein